MGARQLEVVSVAYEGCDTKNGLQQTMNYCKSERPFVLYFIINQYFIQILILFIESCNSVECRF